jgi:hypothetical protein
MDWIDLAQARDQLGALVNTVMNLQVPWNAGKFLSSCIVGGFSRRSQLHEWVINPRKVSCVNTYTAHSMYIKLADFQKATNIVTKPYLICGIGSVVSLPAIAPPSNSFPLDLQRIPYAVPFQMSLAGLHLPLLLAVVHHLCFTLPTSLFLSDFGAKLRIGSGMFRPCCGTRAHLVNPIHNMCHSVLLVIVELV